MPTFLLFCVILLFSSCSSLAHPPHFNNLTDQRSLLEFKAAITNDPLRALANWNPNISFCRWTGVTCTSHRQRVVAINLSGMQLEGTISPFLANLSFLRSLDLHDNNLRGLIPPQLGRLFRLRVLILARNSLEGPIPTSLPLGCRDLELLALPYNSLSGSVPGEVGLLAHVKFLYLEVNNFTGTIPSSLGNLSALTELDLDTNSLEGAIPVKLGELTHLQLLYLHANKLSGTITPCLSNISTLTDMELGGNGLIGVIPRELGMLPNLSTLYLDKNQLTGQIPVSLSNCTSLQRLALSSNRLSGHIPQEFGMLPNLSALDLYENQLTGQIPASLSNCTSLEDLDLSINKLSGHVPQELRMLTNLSALYLDENHFTGQVPASLSNCTSLLHLDLSSNQLSGHIPQEVDMLPNLQYLSLWGNQLSGNIPFSLGNCSQLTYLFLGSNKLNGEVPRELGKLALLEKLYLQHNQLVSSNTSDLPFIIALTNCSLLTEVHLGNNQLAGMLPLSIGRLSTRLNYLNLSGNNIGGKIPHHIGNLTNVTMLSLADNSFSGSIPTSLKNLQKLERLYLQGNRLNGSMPTEIGQMASLGLLQLDNNMLSGGIPNALGDLQQLRRLFLHHNRLSGKIPANLGNCQILELLDLSHNKLSGSIPPEVAGLKNLLFYFNLSWNLLQGPLPFEISKIVMAQAIDVSVNRLSGIIPGGLGSCIALENLNLSRNGFQGPIPASLGKLKNLQDMDLSYNSLSGAIPESLRGLQMLHTVNLSFNDLTGEVSQQIFANHAAVVLLMGNPRLCGPHIYSLMACSKHRSFSLLKRVILPIVGGIIFILWFLSIVFIFIWKRGLNRQYLNILKILYQKTEHPRISYQQLVIATNGFDEGNLIGVGRFGSVYRGILNDGMTVAIKVLNLQSEASQRSFNRECRALRSVRHRNLIRIITSCSSMDFKCLVLQFMSNGSLEKHLYPNGSATNLEAICILSLTKRLNIAIDIAHGVAYLHHDCFIQVAHCDLKPSNILLDDNMTAVVSDFGIAKLIGANSTQLLTSSLAITGSIGYIAPEYGVGATISTNGDVYSFGIVLLEMLTRKRPTDNIFVDGLTLQKWVSMAFPKRILDVVDSSLLTHSNDDQMDQDKTNNCLIQLAQVALLCTSESPQERPNMREIIYVLEKIRGTFIETIRESWLQSDISYLISSQIGQSTNVGALETQSSSTS